MGARRGAKRVNQERARRHARWRLPSGVYNPVVSADGRRWRDYEQAAEAPAPSLEDRRLEVRLAALPLGVDTVTLPVVPAARNGENGHRGGHGLGALTGRRAGPLDPRDAVTAATPADAGATRSAGDREDAGDPEDLGDFEDFEDAQDSEDAPDAGDVEGFEDAEGFQDAEGFEDAEGAADGEAAREAADETVPENSAEETDEKTAQLIATAPDGTPQPEKGAAGPEMAGAGATGSWAAGSGAEPGGERSGFGEPSAGLPGVGMPGIGMPGAEESAAGEPNVGASGTGELSAGLPGVGMPGIGMPGAEESAAGEPGPHDSGDLTHVVERVTPATETDGTGTGTDADIDSACEYEDDDVEDPAKLPDPLASENHLGTAAAGTQVGAVEQDCAAEQEGAPVDEVTTAEATRTAVPTVTSLTTVTAMPTVESDRPQDPMPETGHDVAALAGQDEWLVETSPAPTLPMQPGMAADDGPETGELDDADDFWSAVLRDETERDWLDSPDRPRRLEETRPYGRPGGLAEADPGGQVSLMQAVSGRFPDPRGTWIRLINAEGPTEDAFRSNNAVDCALSVMSTWHGEPVVAARRQPEYDGSGRPLLTGETGGVARAEEWLGHRFEYVGHGRRAYVAIAQRLIFGGHGAAAVLITRWAGGGSHAWNAVNCRGEVLWIDAQRGHMAVEPPYEDVTGVFAVVIDRQGRRL